MKQLTALELKVLKKLQDCTEYDGNSEYYDFGYNPFAFGKTSAEEKGALSSLVKKGIIDIWGEEPNSKDYFTIIDEDYVVYKLNN